MKVEAPLSGGGSNFEFEGSWYAATISGVHRDGLILDFDETAGLPVEESEAETRCGQRLAFDLVRPVPPPNPAGFAKMVELGLTLELMAEGGWWEVELLGVTGGGFAEPLPFDPSREMGVDSRVRVSKKDSEFDQQFGDVVAISDGCDDNDVLISPTFSES